MALELLEPETLDEALALLDPEDPAVRPVAGGTALMLMMKSGLYAPRRLVSLRRLGGGLAQIRETAEGGLGLGAMVRLVDLEGSPEIARRAPVLAETLATHSNVRVRNVATVGGNLAHGDPHMDLPPVMIALGAVAEAARPGGRREIPVEALYAGYMETALANDELITAVTIPPQSGRRAAYVKMTARAAEDWPALGIAVSLAVEGAAIRAPRLAIGAASDRPLRLADAEAVLSGGTIGEALIIEAGRAAAAEAPVVADEHGSAPYKRALVAVAVERGLRRVLDGLV